MDYPASYRGRPVYFEVMGPWSKPPGQRTISVDVTPYNVFLNTMFFLAVVSGVLLARRNLRAGRGHRAGAFKLSGCVTTATTVPTLGWVSLLMLGLALVTLALWRLRGRSA